MKKISLLILAMFLFIVSACGGDSSSENNQESYVYNDFTATEKAMYNQLLDEVIPFVPNNEYYVDAQWEYITFYTIGNTSDEFEKYKTTLLGLGYINTAWSVNEGYTYEKGDIKILISYVEKDGKNYLTVIAYSNPIGDGETDNPTVIPPTDGPTVVPPTDNPTLPVFETITYTIGSSMPNGLTYITNNSSYPDPNMGSSGGLKLRFEGQGVQTTSFQTVNQLYVTIVIGALNENTKTGTNSDYFTVYGLNASGSVVATSKLTSVKVGDNTVNLSGNGIVSVKVIMTGYPYNGNKYCNPLMTGLVLSSTGEVSGGNNGGSTTTHTYSDFTSSEKTLFNTYIGEVIPFLANDEYYVEGYYDVDDYENGMCFYTFGNTSTEFNSYLSKLESSGYELYGTEADDYGDTWYTYIKNEDIVIDAVFFTEDGVNYVNVFVYSITLSGDGEGSGGDSDVDTPPTGDTSITISEFLNLADTVNYYELTGTVTDLKNDVYGNFTLVDSTGSVYVYGLLPYEGANKGQFASTGVKVGDIITLCGVYHIYNGSIEVSNAYLVEIISGENTGGNTGSYTYSDFTSSEKNLFNTYIGGLIPFLPTNEYYVEGYYEETDYENGMYFGTAGNTQAEFNSYLALLESNGFEYYSEEADTDGDVWYTYIKNDDIVLDTVFYTYQGETYVDVLVYSLTLSSDGNGGTGGGSTGSDENVITNEGAGLPEDSNGVYDVDFTDATYVKNVTEQGYYLGGCPTTGDVKVLVIPVEFSDKTAASMGYDLNKLSIAFNGVSGTTDYHSVSEYYFISSYQKLDLEFVVLDSWFMPSNTSSYYLDLTMDYYGSYVEIGDQVIMDEALAYLESRMDLSEFDSDNNGYIDAVVLINTLDVNADVTMQWAYRYWNIYSDDEGYLYEYDSVCANDYLWASYQFLLEDIDDNGNTSYNSNNMNTYTFIHEFGHVLGADDYYDTAYYNEPLLGCDVMDSMLGDHNAFTKFNYGWLTSSRLVVADTTVTLTLEDFSKNGDTIIIANNWDPTLGAYQEYYVLVYYRNTGLNGGDYGYFARDGIVVYHVNASLYIDEYDGEVSYDIYNNNTDASDYYGTKDNLIEFITNPDGDITHITGMSSSSSIVDDQGNKISYIFTVDSMTEDYATITFVKND